MDWGFIIPLLIAIVVLAILSGAYSLRRTKGSERGSPPGKGNHVIDIDYNSGGGGGSQVTRYTIPKDPQEYAKRFVPHSQNTEKKK